MGEKVADLPTQMPVLSIIWNPDPYIFEGIISLRWYSLLFGMAVLAGAYMIKWFFDRENAPQSELMPLFAVILISGLIGARLVHCLFYDWAYFSQHPSETIMFWNGGFQGMASHGGGLGMLIGVYLFARIRHRVHFWWYADRLAIAFPAGGILIRLGNLMNSEIVGTPTDLPWGFVFVQIDNLARHPVQLYEVLMLVILIAFMLGQYLHRLEKIPLGRFVAWFFIWVPTIRFLIDFAKADEYWAFGLKTGQLLHIPFLLFGCLMWIASERRWLS